MTQFVRSDLQRTNTFKRLKYIIFPLCLLIFSLHAEAQITGASSICAGLTTTLSATPAGGTWSSSVPAIATVGSSSGVVTGVAGGTTTISYVSGSGTFTRSFTVNPLPASFVVTGGGSVCAGSAGLHVGLTSSTSGISYQLYNGATTAGAPLIGTGGALDFGLQSAAGTYTVIATNTATGCTRTMSGSAVITVNPTPSAISGPSAYCPGATATLSSTPTGGVWTSSATSVATIGSSSGLLSAVTSGTSNITYTLPTGCTTAMTVTVTASTATITAPSPVCTGATDTLIASVSGGVWSTSPSSVASIGSLSGILTGISGGTANVTYSLGTLGCTTIATVSVVNGPASITGAAYACVGSTTTLSDATTGGTWSSSAPAIASISGSGVVTGMSTGAAVISYTAGGCSSTLAITVNSSPAAITGTSLMCVGYSVTLGDVVSGGIWSSVSSNVTVGSASGVVTGLSPGTASISYSIGGCFTTYTVTVVPVPGAIFAPSPSICVGSSMTLLDLPAGGTWTSSNPSAATINTTTGVVTGVASGTTIISYTTGCTVVAPIVVNPISPITGTPVVCVGQTVTLADATLGGTWSSSPASIATVSGGGVVTGIATGLATIDYTMSSGCRVSTIVTVNPDPVAISGPSSVCVGMTISLSDASPAGTWSSSNPSVATIDPAGVVTGVSFGVTTITYAYSSTTGCFVTKTVTVNSAATAISGPSNVCLGSTITLTDVGSGTWSSSTPAVGSISTAGVVYGASLGATTITFTLTTTCYATTTVNVINTPMPVAGPDSICSGGTAVFTDPSGTGVWSSGSPFIASVGSSTGIVTGITTGTATITFSNGPGCFATRTLTINPLPGGITGVVNICPGSTSILSDPTSGGVWTSSNPSIATIDSATGLVTALVSGSTTIVYTIPTGCTASRVFTVVSGPVPISGYNHICIGTSAAFADATPGGAWISSVPSIASVSAGGVVTGMAAGTATITYTTGTICPVTFPVTVTPFPAAIAGSSIVCEGATTTLSEIVAGGSWSSSNTGVATVGSASGIVTGVLASPVTIFYTIGPACAVAKNMTVNPEPLPISGPTSVCQTQAITLSDATSGGVWSSSNPATGSVDAFGDVTGILPGVTNILYTNGFSCSVSYPVTVNVMPSPIGGSLIACLGRTSVLTDTAAGGTWSSFTPSVATIGSSTGIVTGLSLGTTTIVYMMPATGCFVSATLSVDPLPATYTITGGGSRCAGDTGVHIGLSGSDPGFMYYLYLGSTSVGSFPGSGSALDFGLQTLAGFYTVKSTNTATGCTVTMTGTDTIIIIPSVTPSVRIASSPNDTVCAGGSVTVSPIPVNGGAAPSYQWYINSVPVAAATSYTYVPANGDVVTVDMTSNAVCPLPNPVHDTVTMAVLPYVNPIVNIFATPGDTVCQGTPVTLHAVPTYGGPSPSYTWIKNGAVIPGGASYTFAPHDGDVLSCIILSDYLCLLSALDTSAPLTMKVDTPVIPGVFIGASPSTTVLRGQQDTLTAYVTGAISPTYQWYLNDSLIPGATTNTYINTYNALVNDSITCVVTTNGTCRLSTFQWTYVNVIDGIGQLTAGGDISLMPNPNKGEFIIRGTLSNPADDNVHLEMTDMLSRVVYKEDIQVAGGKLNKHIQPGALANGMYLLSLRSGEEYKVFHIVVEQ